MVALVVNKKLVFARHCSTSCQLAFCNAADAEEAETTELKEIGGAGMAGQELIAL
jgi:hypothetical protein